MYCWSTEGLHSDWDQGVGAKYHQGQERCPTLPGVLPLPCTGRHPPARLGETGKSSWVLEVPARAIGHGVCSPSKANSSALSTRTFFEMV